MLKSREYANNEGLVECPEKNWFEPIQAIVSCPWVGRKTVCSSQNIYAYDAYYMVVSKRLSRPMLTLDDHMAEVARKEGIKIEEI